MGIVNTSRVPTEAGCGALITIDQGHREIHEGDSYTALYTITTAAALGARSGILIKTPAAPKGVHMLGSFACSAASDARLCEAPTVTANVGSHGNVIYNRLRGSANTSGIFDNATVPVVNKFTTLTEAQIAGDGSFALGTVLRTFPVSIGTGPQQTGGTSRADSEYILAANTKYLVLLTTTSGSATTHWLLLDWYEV